MARLVFDGNYKVYWLDTAPADSSAPTVAEITAGTDLTSFIPKDGFKSGVSNNRVSGGSLDERFMDESMGTWSSQLSIDFFLDKVTADNTADACANGAADCATDRPGRPITLARALMRTPLHAADHALGMRQMRRGEQRRSERGHRQMKAQRRTGRQGGGLCFHGLDVH